MKRWYTVALAWGCAFTAQAEVWALRMPESYVMPSYARATYISRMGERHGGSHMGLQEYTLNVPFTDPRRSHVHNWWINMQGNATVTLLDVGGDLDLRKNELFDFSIPVTLIRPIDRNRKFMFTLMPHIASDGVHPSHAWDLAAMADYSVQVNDKFTYSIGLAASPRFADYVVVPYVSFDWKPTPDWQVRMRGYRLSAMYKVNERLSVGPAVGGEGGTWMVSTEAGERVLRVRSLAVAGVVEYDFSKAGQSKRILTAAVGTTLATSVDICKRNLDHDRQAGFHYKPGLLLSAGVDFRF